MDWKKSFDEQILRRGRSYYRQGKVKSLKETESGYSARVHGTRRYHVNIEMQGNVLLETDCDCPYSREGYYCKHEAATLYKLEEKLGEISFSDPNEVRYDRSAGPESVLRAAGREVPEEPGQSQRFSGDPVSGGSTSGGTPVSYLKELNRLQKEVQKEFMAEKDGLPENTKWADYRYFFPKTFRVGLNISPKLLQKARKLMEDGTMCNLTVQTGYLNQLDKDDMVGVAYADTGIKISDGNCRILFDRHRILETDCSNWKCRTTRKPDAGSYLGYTLCEHEVAAILMTEEYLKENYIGDSTDRSAWAFLNAVQNRVPDTPDSNGVKNAGPLSLEPVLEIADFGRQITASFRVGSPRLYKIRYLPDFAEHVRQNQVMAFGSKTQFQLGMQYFSERGARWMEFLLDYLDEEERRRQEVQYLRINRHYDNREEFQIGADIPLYGLWLDRFFELMGEVPIEAMMRPFYEKRKTTLYAKDGKVPVEFTIRPEYEEKRFDRSGAPVKRKSSHRQSGKQEREDANRELSGVRISGKLNPIFPGHAFDYYVEEPFLYRIEGGTFRKLKPLWGSLMDGTTVDFRIGRQHLPEFYEDILPWMRETVSLKEENLEEVLPWLPPKPEFHTYLDAEPDVILCRPEAVYGEQICPLDSLIGDTETGIDAYRNLKKESAYMDAVTQTFRAYDENLQALFAERSDDVVYDFLTGGIETLMQFGEVHVTERFQRLRIRRRVPVSMGVSLESNLLDLSVETEELSQEELLEVLHACREKKKYVRLKSGDFIELDENETLEQLSILLDSLHIPLQDFVAGKMQLPAYRALYLDKMLEQVQDLYFDRDRRFKSLIRNFRTVEEADYELPEPLDKQLRQYQAEGYRWMRTLDAYGFGGILADEMGLGKTLQTIATILACTKEEQQKETADGKVGMPSIVVCPASLVYNWGDELTRFAPELTVSMITGTKKEREGLIAACQTADVLVTSYDLLKRDINLYENITFRFAVIDEAQYIKNSQTAAAKAVKLIRSRTRYALTGTPIENRLSELWSIFDFLMPGFLYDYPTFRREMEMPIAKNGDEGASERLKKMVGPFILRRRKADVLRDLPEKLEEHRYAVMEKKQRKLYDAHVKQMQIQLAKQSDEDFGKNRIEILAQLTRIRQLCCDPAMYLEDYDGASAKRELCMELIHSIIEGEHKALIFSQFTSMLELLEQDLEREGIRWYKITGATPKEKRMELVKAFNEDDTPLFLISLKAGGTGLNLTGADVVIHYDPWWNLAVQNQATDRAHRIGQTKKVTVYKLIAKNTIEERIVEMQEAKRKLAEDILSADAISSSTLRREELLELLE